MAENRLVPKNYPIRLDGDCKSHDLVPIGAVVREGINEAGAATVEFICNNKALDLNSLVGGTMNLVVDGAENRKRWFRGVCISAEYLGSVASFGRFTAEVRSWIWFLGRRANSRIFQEKSVPDIIQDILGDYGFSSDIEKKLSGTYATREFCVQYRETDLEFIRRLMEEEGAYFYFLHDGETEKMVLADAVGGHTPIDGNTTIDFQPRKADYIDQGEHVFEWVSSERTQSGKVTLDDYNFEKPKADLTSANALPKGSHKHKGYELYDAPGRFREASVGEHFARVRMEAEAANHQTWNGSSNSTAIGVGRTFTLGKPPRAKDESNVMVTKATYYLMQQIESGDALDGLQGVDRRLEFPASHAGAYGVVFQAVPKSLQYRAPQVAKWPEIVGIQTAEVVGPSGEEIYTDKYGRVRIKFHWDRDPAKDDTASCWVRTMQPWTGKNWGMIAVPRIGQEVVVQFEEGNPDRPLVIGMLYNADTMPPYTLPENKTQSGVKTRSTKSGTGFNELMFEDKKGAELVRFQAERDYKQIVQNDATITVGLEDKDKGDMSLTVHRNLTETLDTGDHTFTVAKGNQTIAIKSDKKEKIEGKSTLTVTGNVSETIKQGNFTREIKMGNEKTTVSLGDYTVDTTVGKIALTAMQEITLTVGGSSIKVDMTGVTISAPIIKLDGIAMIEAKAPLTNVSGDGLLVLKGGITMIN